jgi:predicted transcriptional regulator
MATKNELTELLVNMLAKNGGIKSSDLAEVIGQDKMVVRNELIELEKLGIVYRTGATRGTRWHLG